MKGRKIMSNENNPLKTLSDALANAVAKAATGTVLVAGRHRMPASGIVFAPDLILTADHILERDEGILVILPDGKEVSAEVTGRDPSSDLALLRLSEPAASVPETYQGEIRVGEVVLALGRPSPNGPEASLGVVGTVDGPVRTFRGGMIERYIRTDAAPLPGFSGGPLVNVDGQIIGINTSGLSHSTLISIPVSVAWKTAQTLAEHGSIRRGYLGVSSQIVEIPETAHSSLKREQKTGLLVINIEADSPAAASEMIVGDILVGIAGEPVADHDELAARLTGEVVGKPVAVDVLRGGELKSIEITIGERPSRARGPRGRYRQSTKERHAGRHGQHHPRHHHP
jgi:S1-C subfamily serine protease